MPKTTKKTTKKTLKKTIKSKNTSKTSPKKSIVKKNYEYHKQGNELIIVESPAKAKTIKNFLGKNYDIQASMGHIVDLPKKELGIDISNGFKPIYEVSPDKKKVLTQLKKYSNEYNKIWLATDEDREGEAIAWHIANELKLDINEKNRIAFHEITDTAVQNALKSPRKLNINLIDAQQARRVLDRLVGFKISPILWKKINKGLSAGRVQSVAVKLIVEREREIQSFIPEEKRKIKAQLNYNKTLFVVELDKFKGNKINIKNEDDFKKFIEKIGLQITDFELIIDEKNGWKKLSAKKEFQFKLIKSQLKESKKSPPAPFITSTLQQAASNRLGWGVKQVMSIAQKLYENGFITYMRTDSVILSKIAIDSCKKYIINTFGEKYSDPKNYKGKTKNAQEAHEAIRPTKIENTPNIVNLSGQEAKLYELIWNRTLASQMSNALFDVTTYIFDIINYNDIKSGKQINNSLSSEWIAKGEVLKFDGFLKLYPKQNDGNEDENQQLPKMIEGDISNSIMIFGNQTFSKPPARYTEASLVKKLESEGIGRPSTYAPVISTIQQRGYVIKKEDKKLYPLDIAFVVNDYLEKFFTKLIDYKFTANMETDLDKIADGEEDWTKMISNFYKGLEKNINVASEGDKVVFKVGKKCPECFSELIYKHGKQGKFIACEAYPNCKYTENTKEDDDLLAKLKEKYEGKPCEAGGTLVVKVGRFGPFLTSSEYPKVKWIKGIPNEKIEKLEEKYGGGKCDKCGKGVMHIKNSKRGPFLACDRYPDCKNAKNVKEKND